MSAKSSLVYHNEDAARKHLESVRWPHGPVCPKCGSSGRDHYAIKPKAEGSVKGRQARRGLWKCRDCRSQFSVTVGTLFEGSKIPLHKWIYAAGLMAASKRGVSARHIHRTVGVTYKTAWFMRRHLREAMESVAVGAEAAIEMPRVQEQRGP